jgi:hypothetical protein
MALKWDPEVKELVLDGDSLNIVVDQDAVVQQLRAVFRTWRGEWFLDGSVGIPYRDEILVKSPDPVVVDSTFKLAILSVPGVIELLEYSLQLDNQLRRLNLSFKARTVDGIIDFSEAVP